jgi:hypothetical protein
MWNLTAVSFATKPFRHPTNLDYEIKELSSYMLVPSSGKHGVTVQKTTV